MSDKMFYRLAVAFTVASLIYTIVCAVLAVVMPDLMIFWLLWVCVGLFNLVRVAAMLPDARRWAK